MSVIGRIAKVAKPYSGSLFTGFAFVFISEILDTAVLTTLFAMLLALVTTAATNGGKVEIPFLSTVKGTHFQFLTDHVQPMLEQFFSSPDPARVLIWLTIITACVVLTKFLFDVPGAYLMHKFANKVGMDLRQKLFAHLLRLSPTYFEKESTGAHMSRITGDVGALQACMGPQLADVLRAVLTIPIALTMMLLVDWKLTLIALTLAPVIGGIMALGGRLIRKYSIRIQERLGDFNASLVERLGNVRVIQSFVREPHENKQMDTFNQRYYREILRAALVTETIAPGSETIAIIGMLGGVIVGGLAVMNGHVPAAQFIQFLFLAQKVGTKFKMLSRANQLRQQVNGLGERIFGLLDVQPDIEDIPQAQALPRAEGHIEFDHVSFTYRTGEEVLSDINLTVQPGEVIALVGPSGSGKTTLVNLLPRFYDPTVGVITIEGRDIRQVTLASLREQVGIVPQETVLFSGSIYDNILYGKLDASEDEVRDAASAANALEFIERLPEGFQTVVGERGARLSGGQRQRVAIARALLKNPRILILDEATSALDTESEHLVQQALETLMKNRTTFVIAHRLSTIQNASRIVVLENGKISEIGTHTELLGQGGIYRKLHQMQFRDSVDPQEIQPLPEVL